MIIAGKVGRVRTLALFAKRLDCLKEHRRARRVILKKIFSCNLLFDVFGTPFIYGGANIMRNAEFVMRNQKIVKEQRAKTKYGKMFL